MVSKLAMNIVQVQLLDTAAVATDQQLEAVSMFGAGTGHVGVERLDAMHQSLLDQEVQRAIDRGRPGRGVLGSQPVEQIIGLQSAAGVGNDLQHPLANGGKAHAAFAALAQRLLHQGLGVDHGGHALQRTNATFYAAGRW